MKYGNQKNKIPVVKHCRNTERNYEVDLEIPDGNDRILSIEVFDLDKVGKDKSCGKLVQGKKELDEHFRQLQKLIALLDKLMHWVIGKEHVATTSEQEPLHDVLEIIREDSPRESRTRIIKENLAEIIKHWTDLKKTIVIRQKELEHALLKPGL